MDGHMAGKKPYQECASGKLRQDGCGASAARGQAGEGQVTGGSSPDPVSLLSLRWSNLMMSAISTDDTVLIIRRSLQREIGLLETKERLTQKEIEEFERKYGRTSADFISEFEQGKLGDSQDCFEWWGLLQGMRAIKGEIKKAKAVLSS